MPSTRSTLTAELARQQAACDAAESTLLEQRAKAARLRKRIADDRAELKSVRAVVAAQLDTLAECRVRIRQIKRELRAMPR